MKFICWSLICDSRTVKPRLSGLLGTGLISPIIESPDNRNTINELDGLMPGYLATNVPRRHVLVIMQTPAISQ